MKILLVAMGFVLACGASEQPIAEDSEAAIALPETAQQDEPTVITRHEQLNAVVGKRVTLRGVLANSKVPTILGVDVALGNEELAGQFAQAIGVLHRSVVTQDQIDARIAAEGQFAHRGPGTFYSLRNGEKLAQATPVPKGDLAPASNASYEVAICRIAADIEALRDRYPQLAEFSATKHCDADALEVGYGFRTHQAKGRGGWAGSVPNPDPTGVWFHIDFHDADSRSQIHTQPMVAPLFYRDKKAMLLILEGKETKPLGPEIYRILRKNGVTDRSPSQGQVNPTPAPAKTKIEGLIGADATTLVRNAIKVEHGRMNVIAARLAESKRFSKGRVLGYPVNGALTPVSERTTASIVPLLLADDSYAWGRVRRCKNDKFVGIRFGQGSGAVEFALGMPCAQALWLYRAGGGIQVSGAIMSDIAVRRLLKELSSAATK